MNLPRYILDPDGKLQPADDGALVLHQDVLRGMGQMQSIIAYLVHWHCNDGIMLSFERMYEFAQSGHTLKITITDDNRDVVLRVEDA